MQKKSDNIESLLLFLPKKDIKQAQNLYSKRDYRTLHDLVTSCKYYNSKKYQHVDKLYNLIYLIENHMDIDDF